jgi:hypothetical protein
MIHERPYVATTIYGPDGEVIGCYLSDGTFLESAPTPKVEWCWDEKVAKLVPYEVVWCGSTIKHDWSKTRGELLGDYACIPISKEVREVAPARVKVATWAQNMEKEEVNAVQEDQ